MAVDLVGLNQESENELFRAFTKLFPYRLSSVIRRGENGRWFEISRFHYLTDNEIFEALQSKSGLERGFRSEDDSAFIVLKIPAESQYHNSQFVIDLREKLKELAVEPCHYQIDRDWYLYIFLDRFAQHGELSSALCKWLEMHGFAATEGQLELYPAEKAIPFPLQGNFTWLNERCQLLVRRGELSLKDALGFFLDQASKAMSCPQELLQKIRKSCGDCFEQRDLSAQGEAETENLLAEMLETAGQIQPAFANNPDSFVEAEPELEQIANVLALPLAGREFNEQGIEESLLFPELDIYENEGGSRLVVFEDSVAVAEPVKAKSSGKSKKQEDAQLLLFPTQEPAKVAVEKKEAKPVEPAKRKNRRTRNKQKRKGQG